MRNTLYLLSGSLFGLGLSLSGMIDPTKIQSFLSLGSEAWNPALIFVLGFAVLCYFVIYRVLVKIGKTLNGKDLERPLPRPIDRKLVVGSAIFGIGWGLAGVCPGPALVHLSFFETPFLLFILTMIVGFEAQRRLT